MKYFVVFSISSLAALIGLTPVEVAGQDYSDLFHVEKKQPPSNFAIPSTAAPSHYGLAPDAPNVHHPYFGPGHQAPPYWNPNQGQRYPYMPVRRPRPEAPADPGSPRVSGYVYGYTYRTDKDGKVVVEPLKGVPQGVVGGDEFTIPPIHGPQVQPRYPWAPRDVFGQPLNSLGHAEHSKPKPISFEDRLTSRARLNDNGLQF